MSSRNRILLAVLLAFGCHDLVLMSFPTMFDFVSAELGTSHTQEGLLMSVVFIAAILLGIPLGRRMDRADLRRYGFWGLVVMLPGIWMCSVSSYPAMLLGRFLVGVGGIVLNLVGAAAIGRHFQGKKLGTAMGIFQAVFPATAMVDYLFVRAVAEGAGWRSVVLGTAGIAVACVLLFPLLWSEDRGAAAGSDGMAAGSGYPAPEVSASAAGGDRARLVFILLCVEWFLFCFAGGQVTTFGSAFIGETSADASFGDGALALLMLGVLPGSPLAGRLLDRVRDRSHVLVGSAVLAVLLGLLFMLRIGPPHAVLFLMGMLQSGIPVGTYALVAEVSPRLKVATWFGILLTASNLGSVLGPALSGWLKDVTGSHLPGMAAMCGISVLMLAACVLVLAIRRSAPTPGSEVAEQARAE